MTKGKEPSVPDWVKTLRRLMDAQNYNPRSLSLEAGLNATAVRDMIEGRSRYPRYDTVQALAKALNTTPAQLMSSEKTRSSPRIRDEDFSNDIELLTEIIAHLQEAATEMGRDLLPREFAAMSATIYRRLHDNHDMAQRKNRVSAIKPQIHDLLEYETLRLKRSK